MFVRPIEDAFLENFYTNDKNRKIFLELVNEDKKYTEIFEYRF